jgi:hypothetical protein
MIPVPRCKHTSWLVLVATVIAYEMVEVGNMSLSRPVNVGGLCYHVAQAASCW